MTGRRVPPLLPADAAAAQKAYPGLRDQLPAIIDYAREIADSRGEAATFARLAHAISTYDHVYACRIGAAAILRLSEATP
jgi:hypothetical protein